MPAFMPVATQGTVKGLTARSDLRQTGAQMVLGNALSPRTAAQGLTW